LANAVIREGSQVSKAVGIKLAIAGPNNLKRVLDSSSRNKSSMLQDIERGKKTEVRQINGIISDLGKRNRIPTPYNSLLTIAMIELETFPR
jgi:2-dehydropantoate 2-reductase